MSKPGQISTGDRSRKEAFRIWGLTGGIASGKSTAAKLFASFGIPVLDADQVARELSEEGGLAHPAILQRFGTADRSKLRDLIFSDPKAKQDLESILHPLIRTESMKRMRDLVLYPPKCAPERKLALPVIGASPIVIYEATLLIETGRYRELEGLIVVDAPRELRKTRLMARAGIEASLAEKILDAQALALSDEARRRAATLILDNHGTEAELESEVRGMIPRLYK